MISIMPADRPLRVGSVKTNLGHLESASGIGGLIKVVLSMGHEEIPRQLHFRKRNPRISLGSAPIEIPVNAIAWPRSERPRIAGVSSFGFSGTNAHVILPLPSTLTFNYPTIKALVDYLLSDVLGFDSALAPEKTAPIPSPVKVVSFEHPSEDLSEEEISLLLLKKLE